jgi:hypothetical protein
LLPFLVGRLARFVEDVGMDRQLTDVVQERRPAEPVAVVGRESQFVGDEVGEETHAFRVTPSTTVVLTESCGQGENFDCRGIRLF